MTLFDKNFRAKMEPSDLVRLFLFKSLFFKFQLESVYLENDVAPKRYSFLRFPRLGSKPGIFWFSFIFSRLQFLWPAVAPPSKKYFLLNYSKNTSSSDNFRMKKRQTLITLKSSKLACLCGSFSSWLKA